MTTMKLTQAKTVTVKMIAKYGIEDIERAGGKVEKVSGVPEPALSVLNAIPGTVGVARVTFPAGTWERITTNGDGIYSKHWLLSDGTIIAYLEDGKPLSYAYKTTSGAMTDAWVAGNEEGCPSLTTVERQADFDRYAKTGNDWRSRFFPGVVL